MTAIKPVTFKTIAGQFAQLDPGGEYVVVVQKRSYADLQRIVRWARRRIVLLRGYVTRWW